MVGAHPSSSYTIRAVGAFSRLLLNYGCSKVQVHGLDRFLGVLNDNARRKSGRGLLTYCNHISVMDEPTIWGCLPASTLRNANTVRWTLGASDIMFQKSKLLASFFRSGQCIETHRGAGIFQPAIDESIAKLDEGKWVHLFPEGYVNVTTNSTLRRFKWGISRMLLEAETLPVVVPIWLTGFDRLMPEPRSWPRWMPRLGNPVSIHFGEPIHTQLAPALQAIRESGVLPADMLPESLRTSSSLCTASPVPPEQQTPSVPSFTPPAHQSEWTHPIRAAKTSTLSHASPKSSDSARNETLQSAQARSQLTALLRHHLALVGQQHRAALGKDPLIEDTLCHTESLIPTHQQQDRTAQDGTRKDVGV